MSKVRPIADCHVHTAFSPDSNTAPEVAILRGIELGLQHIAITDHIDTMWGTTFDAPQYFLELTKLKEQYSSKIYVAIGVEAGWSPQSEAITAQIVDNYPFDYVINSAHSVNDSDCYHQPHFMGRSRETVYNEYYLYVAKMLDSSYNFHAVGHLDYILRNAPYPNKIFEYKDFADVLDTLLTKIITRDKILEYNTVSPVTTPSFEAIFRRFYKLGGRNVCFSSDAHTPGRIADGYSRVKELFDSIGYKYLTVVQDGKYVCLPL